MHPSLMREGSTSMPSNILYSKPDTPYACSVLREYEEWGLRALDLVHPPRRFWSDQKRQDVLVEEGIGSRRLKPYPTPAEILQSLPPNDSWLSQGRRSINRLHAHYLICEDPQRRMDVREVETLAHQVSLVRHVLQDESLKHVLIADEVGLGKTVEVGLILRELLAQRPSLRVLYLAPARLVSNVRREFDRLNIPFRQWAAFDGDARLSDPKIIASLHRAVHGDNFDLIIKTSPWDILIVDECHHLSAWSPDGSDPTEAYRLVRELVARQPVDGRLILMSGTPHQGHETRFENLLRFLREEDEPLQKLAGRVIYRTKDDIEDWDGHPVFPQRQVNEPLIVDLGPAHRQWIENIHDFYRPPRDTYLVGNAKRRAAGWRCAQAMQWAASSPQAGLGYLVRQAIRAGWDLQNSILRSAIASLRPYRLGPEDELIDQLFERIKKEVDRQQRDADVEDIEERTEGGGQDRLSTSGLEELLIEGISLVQEAGDEKWQFIQRALLDQAGSEKVVLFAQPIETVSALARYLERTTGHKPAIIIGGQSDAERTKEVESFWRADGPQYLVSSRAGGEGINLQVARRLIHIDVPWNPMDMEQRVGRVHRFGSRETIIIDTVVVKDSREADAYRIAREKLRTITATLVERERFESVFSRVMSLLSQDELQSVLMNEPSTPFDAQDEQRLSDMVQEGFRAWKDFHHRFSEQQKSIQRQNPGLLTWDDVVFFLEELGGAKRMPGYKRQRFVRQGKTVTYVSEDANVLGLANGQSYVCGEHGEELVYGPDGSITLKLGLNLKPVSELLRKYAFPDQACGAAHLRWPADTDLPSGIASLPLGVCIFLRQTLQKDRMGGWLEQGHTLYCYIKGVDSDNEVTGDDKRHLLRGLFRATVRKTAEQTEDLVQGLMAMERKEAERLRRPSDEELTNQIRHAVAPLFTAILTS
jgi:superfamily II DNA or RNA helicase